MHVDKVRILRKYHWEPLAGTNPPNVQYELKKTDVLQYSIGNPYGTDSNKWLDAEFVEGERPPYPKV